MRLNKTDCLYLSVARFAEDAGITFRQAIELRALSRQAFKAGEYALTCGELAYARAAAREQKTGEAVEKYAEPLGLAVSWSGLWPTFTKDGRDYHLPG